MTSRTKRRLAVLALALGLIAAAPYGFHEISDHSPYIQHGDSPWIVMLNTHGQNSGQGRSVQLMVGPFSGIFVSQPPTSAFIATSSFVTLPDMILDLPHESITLRVACAIALAGVWLLVLGGQLLARRWQRTDTK